MKHSSRQNFASFRLSRLGFAFALAAITLGGCASNPTGGTDFVLMSKEREAEVGKEEHEKLMKEAPVYKDEKLQAYVEKVGNKLVAISHWPELQFHFTIIDSPDINAFALPAGYVYVNRGLLNYLTSEAQLAAVLGHEIGHITGRHAVKQQTAARGTNALATVASVASILTTGTSVLGDTASLFGGALVSGYGRDMELEADGLGAEYLVKAGYDPNAMVEVISVLKNHEDFMKKNANQGPSYHGLFASHPRSDTRLQEAVRNSGAVADAQREVVDPEQFRLATTGLIVGQTMQNLTGGAEGRNRYYQTLLSYTLVLPDTWTFEETTTTLTAKSPEGTDGILKVEVQRLQQNVEPRVFIRETLKITDLQQAEALRQFGLDGYTGINPNTKERVAVMYYGRRAFVFTGTGGAEGVQNALLESVKSFRPIARNEGIFANPLEISWIQAQPGMTYEALGKESRLPEFPADTLRLMNADYPNGQPTPGEWIKVTH